MKNKENQKKSIPDSNKKESSKLFQKLKNFQKIQGNTASDRSRKFYTQIRKRG